MMKKSFVLPGFALSAVMLLLSAPMVPLMGQDTFELAPEALFEPGIDVIAVEYVPPVTYPPTVPTPAHTPEPRCGFVPYLQIGETTEWQIDYEEAPTISAQRFDTPLILCNRLTGERREVQVGRLVESVSVSPDERYAVLLGIGTYYGYDFHTDRLITLSQPDELAFYDGRGIYWYGNTTILIYESNGGDMTFPWIFVSLGDVTVENSVDRLTTILKRDAVPDFTQYQNPSRAAWVSYEDESCYLEWIVRETGERERFDITGICAVGMPLTDDAYGDYLFTPIQYEDVYEEPVVVASRSRDLVRMNLTTGEREVWYSGEIERMNNLDPSQRYATLILDQNGCINLINPDVRLDNDGCSQYGRMPSYQPPQFEAALLDTTSHEIIYRHSLEHDFLAPARRVFDSRTGQVNDASVRFNDTDAWPGGDLFSLSETQFILFLREPADGEYSMPLRDANDILLTVTADNTVIETPLPGQLLIAGQGNGYLVLNSTERDDPESYAVEGDLLLYDQQGNTTTLIRDVALGDSLEWGTEGQYRLTLERGDAPDELIVRVWNLEQQAATVYTVRVP